MPHLEINNRIEINKYLGIQIDQNFKWKDHIEKLQKC